LLTVDDIMEKMPEQFSMSDIMSKVEERTPYGIVCFQVLFELTRVLTDRNIFS
jgi:hypothetical protein